jgi:hypothetical protein
MSNAETTASDVAMFARLTHAERNEYGRAFEALREARAEPDQYARVIAMRSAQRRVRVIMAAAKSRPMPG